MKKMIVALVVLSLGLLCANAQAASLEGYPPELPTDGIMPAPVEPVEPPSSTVSRVHPGQGRGVPVRVQTMWDELPSQATEVKPANQ